MFKGSNSVQCFLTPAGKGDYSKRKEFTPVGANSFRVDCFSERAWYAGKHTGSHRSCLPCKIP